MEERGREGARKGIRGQQSPTVAPKARDGAGRGSRAKERNRMEARFRHIHIEEYLGELLRNQ